MQTRTTIYKARRLIDSLNGSHTRRLQQICQEITAAQHRLNREAQPFFRRCMERCRGLCCKNIHVSEIVNFLDYVYILTVLPERFALMVDAAAKERLFSADCLFLQDGKGPCIFPPSNKPERCILTFCEDTAAIGRDIRRVRSAFTKLSLYTKLKRPMFWFGL